MYNKKMSSKKRKKSGKKDTRKNNKVSTEKNHYKYNNNKWTIINKHAEFFDSVTNKKFWPSFLVRSPP